jgi:hypothetical protein
VKVKQKTNLKLLMLQTVKWQSNALAKDQISICISKIYLSRAYLLVVGLESSSNG